MTSTGSSWSGLGSGQGSPTGCGGVWSGRLPPHSPNLHARAERFVHTLKSECLERLVLVGEKSLLKVLREFEEHYLTERPHQGIGNSLVETDGKTTAAPPEPNAPLEWDCRRRLGGLLKSYSRKAA